MTGSVIAAGGTADRVFAWLRAHPPVVDTALGAVTVLVAVPTARGPLDVVLLLVAGAALAGRRVRPVAAGAVVAVAGATAAVAGHAPIVVVPAVLVTGYSLAAYGPRWAGPTAAAVTIAGTGLLLASSAVQGGSIAMDAVVVAFVATAILAVTVWLGGTLRRVGRRSVEQLREHARLLETEQAQQARLAALAERARIAREMHDIIAHSLSVIVVHADGGRIGATHSPDVAASVFGNIAATGRSALTDIRTLLGLLRDDAAADDAAADDAPDGGGDGRSRPQPGVGSIATLVDDVSRAGTPVALSVTGTARRLPAGTELTVYRAVQEALTNTVKHAGPGARATVELAWHRDHLALHVTDDGAVPPEGCVGPVGSPPRAGSLGGHGLAGMAERVAAHGGAVDAGARPGGGFGVHLRLPYAEPLP